MRELKVLLDAQSPPIVAAPDPSSAVWQRVEPLPPVLRSTRSAVRAENAPRDPAPRALESTSGVSDPTYYTARDLDVYPAILPLVALNFGPEADRGPEKRVQLLLLVNAAGGVDEASVISGQPAGIYEESVRRAFLLARFTPGERAGRPVRTRLLVEVTLGAGR